MYQPVTNFLVLDKMTWGSVEEERENNFSGGVYMYIHDLYTWGIPCVYMGYTMYIHGVYHVYTWGIPCVYMGYTMYIHGVYHVYTWGIPCVYMGVPCIYMGYTFIQGLHERTQRFYITIT